MRLNFYLLTLTCIAVVSTYAQNVQSPSLIIGDPAPPLRVGKWIKGEPIQGFERGKVYVVEFWATWCRPCIAAMPRLSVLAGKYKDKVIVLGIDVLEQKTTSLEKVKTFVSNMGSRMDYHVAAANGNLMTASWLDASGEQGIPKTFVVDADGRVAWIGHPMNLDEVLSKVVSNTWDINKESVKRIVDKYLRELDKEVSDQLVAYDGDPYKPGDLGKPDSALLMIDEFVLSEPKLKYAPLIASRTFSSLLKKDMHKAYEYAKVVMVTPTYEEPAYDAIIGIIKWYSDKLNLSAEIYQLGAEAYQLKIDNFPYPEIFNTPKYYHEMADWYWRAKDISKAIEAEEKAIEALKGKKGFSSVDLAAFESRLKDYKKM